MTTNEDTTSKVLEALSLNMQETSMAKELETASAQIQAIAEERQKLEVAQRNYLNAQSGATRAAQQAKEVAAVVDKKMQELRILADKVMACSKEADTFAAMARKPVDFTTPINMVANAMTNADNHKKQLQKNIKDVRVRKEELKKEGVELNLDGTSKVPSGISI
jgi:hypothetical protein